MHDKTSGYDLAKSIPSSEELVRRAEALVPLLRKNASEAERLRRLTDEAVEALEDAGLFRMLQPLARGGYGSDPATVSTVMATIASGCPSTTWIMSIYSSIAQLAELLSEEALAEIYAGEHPRMAGVFNRAGAVLERVDGGFRIRDGGRWQFNSGCRHAQWDLLRVAVEETDGATWIAFMAVPMSELTLHDDWDVMGASATGSNSVSCGEIFIPDYRVAPAPTSATSMLPADKNAAIGCALPLGLARYALDAFKDLTETRGINHLGYDRMADAPVVQAAIAAATADVKLIELYHQWVISPFAGGPKISSEDAPVLSIGSVRCMELARGVIERLLDLAPSTEIMRAAPLQRLLRDIHVFQHQHSNTPFINYEQFGRKMFASGN